MLRMAYARRQAVKPCAQCGCFGGKPPYGGFSTVSNIHGKLFIIGADDDSFWEAGKYVRRMDARLKERPHKCEYEALAYEHGTHFVLPESLLRGVLPVGLKFVLKFVFRAAKEYPDECEQTRKDIDRRLSAALREWTADKPGGNS